MDDARLPAHSMRQSKVTDFFLTIVASKRKRLQSQEATSASSLLSLPHAVRMIIYHYAGVPKRRFIRLNRDADYSSESLEWLLFGEYGNDEEIRLPLNLLVSSRVIWAEICQLVYSGNAFGVGLWLYDGLQPLEILSDTTLMHLKVLAVSLCPCKCLGPYCWKARKVRRSPTTAVFSKDVYKPFNGHGRKLGCISRRDKATIRQWKRICSRLASSTSPHQLEIYLMADVVDLETAEMVLSPLLSLPTLKGVSISLNADTSGPIRDLSRFTSHRLMNIGEVQQEESFPFLSLPFDLQLHILGFTDLVAGHHVRWGPSGRLSVQGRVPCELTKLKEDNEHFVDPKLFCCATDEASYSPRCKCRASPIRDLCLVNKAVCTLARSVFYSQNEFRVFTTIYYPPGAEMTDADIDEDAERSNPESKRVRSHFPIASFVERMPHVILWYLRHVTLVFPPCKPSYLLPEQKAWGSWLHAIDLLKLHVHLPALRLEIHFSDMDVMPLEELRARRTRNKPEEEREMLNTYERILSPLKKLEELGCLLIYVAWPIRADAGPDRKVAEARLEKMIMGNKYESDRWGKQKESTWSQPDRIWWTQYH